MTKGDAVYYRSVETLPLAQRLTLIARNRIFQDFMTLMKPRPGERILDVGVSDVTSEESNILETHYPHRGDITCAGLGDGESVRRAYPGIAFAPITPHEALPFLDKSFDIAFANAVLEHVGLEADRRFFLAEMTRVARRVFIAIPHRWFPVEHHTALPLVHYAPPLFYALCSRIGQAHWSKPENLSFLSRGEFRRLWPAGAKAEVRYSGLMLGPFSSNLVGITRV